MKRNINKILCLALSLFILINSINVVYVKADDKYPNLTKQTDKTYTVGNDTYDVYKGTFSYPSVLREKEDNTSVFYYSDGYFYNPSTNYDEHLSSMSLAMAMAACSSNVGNDSNPKDYLYKSQNIKKLMVDIGVDDSNVYLSDTYTLKMTNTTIAYAIGYKKLDEDTILMPIAIRGTGYQSEWYSNFSIGASGEHEGFSKARDEVYQGIENYINEHNLDSNKIKFWIVGYSRAAATANLTAKKLIDTYSTDKVYAYTFGTPRGGVESAKQAGKDYSSIHNIINAADIISLMGPGDMGFIRYGVDHYVPGSTDTSTTTTNTRTWTIGSSTINDAGETLDNTIWKTDSTDYASQKEKMLKQLASIDSEVVKAFNDAGTFKAASLNVFGALGGGDYYNEISGATLTIEDYLIILLRDIEAVGLYNDGTNVNSTKLRETFANDTSNGLSSVSAGEALKVFTSYYKALDDEQYEEAKKCFSGITNRFSYTDLFMIYLRAVNWMDTDTETKISILSDLWDKLVVYEVGNDIEGKTTLLQVLLETLGDDASDEEKEAATIELKDAFYTMFDFLLRVAATDNKTYGNTSQTYNVSNVNYKDKNNKTAVVNLIKDLNLDNEFTYDKYRFNMFIVVGSLVRNSSFFGLNHYPELTFAWVRSYDDYYSDAPSADSKTVNDLKVTATPSCPYNSSSEEYYGDCTLTLSSNYPGTTILYRLYTDEDNKGSYKLYKGSLDLPVGSRYYLDIKSIYLNDKYESDEELNVTYAPIYINNSTNNISEEVYGTSGNSIGYLYAYDDYNTYSSNNYRFIKWDKYTYTDSNNTEQSVDINSTSKSIAVDGTINYARTYEAQYQPLITNVDVEFESGSATPTVKVKKYESDTETTLDTGDYNVSFRLDSKTDSEILVSIIVTLYENSDTNKNYYYSSNTSGVINNKNTESYTGDTVSTYNADEGTLTLTRQYKYDSQSSEFYTVEVDYYDENDTSKTLDNVSGEKFVVNKVTEGTQSPITISAKEIDGEKFVAWYSNDGTKITSETEGYTLSGNKITFTPSDNVSLKAYYNPLITNVSGTIVSLIVDGTLPTSISDGKANTKSSSYEINGTISWEVYEDNTWKSITDLSTYKIKTDMGYRATITPSFKSSSIKYVISDNLTATINGNTLSSVDIDTTGTTPTMKYIMSTKEVVKEDKSLVEVYNPSSVKVDRSDSVVETIKSKLSSITTKVLLADGTTSDVNVTFTNDELNKITYDSTNKNDQIISVTGNITYDNNSNNVSTKVTIRIVVPGLERMATPIASVDSGTYNNPIEVTLSTKTKSDETIYYSLDPEKPVDEWEVYDNKTFSFDYSSEVSENTGRLKPYTISAYVKSSDESTYRDSEIVTFTYTIVKKSESSSSDPYANVKWTEANTPCEVWNKSKNWTWSEKLGKCVYRVHNTKTK